MHGVHVTLGNINTVHDTVKFTIEHSGGGSGVPFLDTLVTVEAQGGHTKIETELYIKPTNSGIILHHQSAHPTLTKHNMARDQFARAIKNSSRMDKEKKSIANILGSSSGKWLPKASLREASQRGTSEGKGTDQRTWKRYRVGWVSVLALRR